VSALRGGERHPAQHALPVVGSIGRLRASEVEEGLAAERIAVVLLVVLRAGTLVLGAAEISGSSGLLHPRAAMAALLALAAQSTAVFGLAAWRLRRRATPALPEPTAVVETAAGVAGLLVVAYATPLSLRTTSTFWIEPYTVISVLVLAASARRPLVGVAGATCLTVTYLVCVFVVASDGGALSSAERATAWTNAISYLPFYAVAAIGFAILRSVVAQTDALRSALGRLSAERARVTAASDAYRIGHDIPKALLREVRRGRASTAELLPRVIKYRGDLLTALRHDERPAVDLREELTAVAGAIAAATPLHVDLRALEEVPADTPKLLVAEAVRELLNNASYHAYGFPIALSARSSPERVQVTVHNDGPGVAPARLASAWALKQSTLHLFETAGGSYEIQSAPRPSAGTTVTVTWPAAAADGRGSSAPGGRTVHASASQDDTG
jgi:signal transduction histidine kinase